MKRFITDDAKDTAQLICNELKNNKEKTKWNSDYYGSTSLEDCKILTFNVQSDRKSIKSEGYLTPKSVQQLFSVDGGQIIYLYYSKHFFPIRLPQVHLSDEELNTLFPDKMSRAETVGEKISTIISNSKTKKNIETLHTGHYALIEKINNFYNKS